MIPVVGRGWGQIDPATVESQSQWVVRIGTVSFLVWANSADAAELRARVDCFDRKTTREYLELQRVVRSGPAHVRPATPGDVETFEKKGAL